MNIFSGHRQMIFLGTQFESGPLDAACFNSSYFGSWPIGPVRWLELNDRICCIGDIRLLESNG